MTTKMQIRDAAQGLLRAVEAMLEPTVPVTDEPPLRHVKITEEISWPAERKGKPDWRSCASGRAAIAISNTQAGTGAEDLAGISVSMNEKEKEELLTGIRHATEIAMSRAEKRKQDARNILNEPGERAALRSLRNEYTIMQLEELKIE